MGIPREIAANIIAKTKAKLRSFLMRSYYKKPIKPTMDLPKENALYINFNHTPTLEDVYDIPESWSYTSTGTPPERKGWPCSESQRMGARSSFGQGQRITRKTCLKGRSAKPQSSTNKFFKHLWQLHFPASERDSGKGRTAKSSN